MRTHLTTAVLGLSLLGLTRPAGAFYFDTAVTDHPGSRPLAVAIGEVTGDGILDVVMITGWVANPLDYHFFVYAGLPDGTLDAPLALPYGPTPGASTHGVVVADLDEDGIGDIVISHPLGVAVILADGAGGFAAPVQVAGENGDAVAAMDVDLDGHLDILTQPFLDDLQVFYGDGLGNLTPPTTIPTSVGGGNMIRVGDVTGDGQLDAVVMSGQNYSIPELTVLEHDGAGGFFSGVEYLIDSQNNADGFGIGDINGDGLQDVVMGAMAFGPNVLWLMTQDGSGGLVGPEIVVPSRTAYAVASTDLDGDGDDDVVLGQSGQIAAMLQDGGVLGPEITSAHPDNNTLDPDSLALGDLDGDGCVDAALATRTEGLHVFYGRDCLDTDGDGVFDPVDNCVDDFNPGQEDSDGDGIGDACDVMEIPTPPDAFCSAATGAGDKVVATGTGTIDGDARSTGPIQEKQNGVILGAQFPNDPSVDYANVTVPGGIPNLGSLALGGTTTFELPAGPSLATKLNLQDDVVVTVAGTANDPSILYVDATTDLKVREDAQLNPGGDPAALILIEVNGRRVKFLNTSQSALALFAPDSLVIVNGSADVTGSLVGNKVQVKGSAGYLTESLVRCAP